MDASSSMAYASDGVSKFDYGSTLAASLAYLMLKQQEAVGLITFSDRIEKMIPPGLRMIISSLFYDSSRIRRRRVGHRPAPCSRTLPLPEKTGVHHPDLGSPRSTRIGRKRPQADPFQGSEVILFHLLDQDELNFPFKEPSVPGYGRGSDTARRSSGRPIGLPRGPAIPHRGIPSGLLLSSDRLFSVCYIDRPGSALVRYLTWRQKFRAR